MKLFSEYTKGLWRENPVFRQILGLCPTLAVTTSVINGFSMGCAVMFVLSCSSFIVSCVRRWIPKEIRIPCYTVIIATFVTLADLFMAAKFPPISKALGPFIPLIVVNCIILGRAEAFASKNGPFRSVLDALGMGGGFTLALVIMGVIREILGSGNLVGINVLGDSWTPWVVMVLPAGAFITLGFVIGVMNFCSARSRKKG